MTMPLIVPIAQRSNDQYIGAPKFVRFTRIKFHVFKDTEQWEEVINIAYCVGIYQTARKYLDEGDPDICVLEMTNEDEVQVVGTLAEIESKIRRATP